MAELHVNFAFGEWVLYVEKRAPKGLDKQL